MKFYLAIVLITIVYFCNAQSNTIDVCSFNIRFDNPDDGEHNWKHRKENVAALIQYYEADLIGMQEVLKSQIEDLEKLLPGYAWVGVGRDDGKEAGEYSPIFYNKDRFIVKQQSTFWLSETCDEPGTMGWDAACNRVVTWMELQDRNTEKVFFIFNTHFDHRGVTARKESAKLIVQKVKEIAGSYPVVITGDFNCTPDSEPYKILAEAFSDAYLVSKTPHYGQLDTFNGFKVPEEDKGRRIDFIFTKGQVEVLKHAILTDSWAGKFPSDHFPVLAKLAFP